MLLLTKSLKRVLENLSQKKENVVGKKSIKINQTEGRIDKDSLKTPHSHEPEYIFNSMLLKTHSTKLISVKFKNINCPLISNMANE